MGTAKVSITLPERIRDAVDENLVGSIGNSRSDAISTALAIYLSERGYLDGGVYGDE